jgi:hypothetical protein
MDDALQPGLLYAYWAAPDEMTRDKTFLIVPPRARESA